MSVCAAPIILKVSNLSLCYKTTPVTCVKLECFGGVCVRYICVLKKPMWEPEVWLNLIIMVLIKFEWC